MHPAMVTRQILELERRVLDAWSCGDPVLFGEDAADEITYFDDVAVNERVYGREAFQAYLRSLSGHIPLHSYEMIDPQVQVYGDVAVLTMRYDPMLLDGTRLSPWKASEVFILAGGGWKLVHSHWSMMGGH